MQLNSRSRELVYAFKMSSRLSIGLWSSQLILFHLILWFSASVILVVTEIASFASWRDSICAVVPTFSHKRHFVWTLAHLQAFWIMYQNFLVIINAWNPNSLLKIGHFVNHAECCPSQLHNSLDPLQFSSRHILSPHVQNCSLLQALKIVAKSST